MRLERGVALITVLLVVALVTVMASALVSRQYLAVQSTTHHLTARQVAQHAQSAEVLAKALLRQDLLSGDRQAPIDHLQENWAREHPVLEMDDGSGVRFAIEDAAGLFNLNRLQTDDQALQQFRRLLLGLGIEPLLAERLKDWLDADHEVSASHSAEENHYLLYERPYRTANRALSHVSELRLITGVSAQDYQKLAPFVSALPASVGINVNTAPARVIACLGDGISLERAQTLVAARAQAIFTSVQGFISHPLVSHAQIDTQGLAVSSQYFYLTSKVQMHEREFVWLSLLQRSEEGWVRVLARQTDRSRSLLTARNLSP